MSLHWRLDESKDEQSANCISHKDMQTKLYTYQINMQFAK